MKKVVTTESIEHYIEVTKAPFGKRGYGFKFDECEALYNHACTKSLREALVYAYMLGAARMRRRMKGGEVSE